jgi:hypothetical protein
MCDPVTEQRILPEVPGAIGQSSPPSHSGTGQLPTPGLQGTWAEALETENETQRAINRIQTLKNFLILYL